MVPHREHVLEREGAEADWIGFAPHGAPKHTLARDRLVEERAQQIITEVGVGSFQGREIRRRQQVEDEPVVTLAEDLDWNAARLLGDQQRAQVVLTTFLDLGDVGLGSRCIFVQHRLRLFDDRDCRDRLWIGCGEFLLVEFTQKENRYLQPVRAWAESIAIARQSWPLCRHFTDRKEVALIVFSQANVLQAPLIHAAQISQRQARVCHGFASVERDLRGNVGLAVGLFTTRGACRVARLTVPSTGVVSALIGRLGYRVAGGG